MLSLLLATMFAVADKGDLPVDRLGRAINLDFEAASLLDWTAEGEAFEGMPIQGDTVQARRSDMRSHHTGDYWVGTYELKGDAPQGTLRSIPFKVTKPFASFLIAGGAQPATRAELVLNESGQVVFTASGDDTEELKRVAADLSKHVGKELFIRPNRSSRCSSSSRVARNT